MLPVHLAERSLGARARTCVPSTQKSAKSEAENENVYVEPVAMFSVPVKRA
jgi:hypothetical protein